MLHQETVGRNTIRTPEPLTLDQVTQHKRPSDPQISPDGTDVLFVLRPISKDQEHDQSEIWRVPRSDGSASQFTTGVSADDEPRWSPDGQSIAFLSDRAERGKSTIYVMPVDGGEGIQAFDRSGDLEDLQWAPDGSALAVLMMEPETDEDKRRAEERDDASVWDTREKFRRLWVVDPKSGKGKCVSPPRRHVVHYSWSPDSQQLAINTIDAPRIDEIFKLTDLWIVSRQGGTAKHLLKPRGDAGGLVWASDGKQIAWIGPLGNVINCDAVFAASLDGSEPRCLTPNYKGTIEHIASVDNGEALLVQAQEGLHSALYQLDWNGELQLLLDPKRGGSLPKPASISSDGDDLAFIWEDATNAPDVWVLSRALENAEPIRRTHLNEALEKSALGCPERVSWQSDGLCIEGLLFKPHGFTEGSTCPLVVQVHGGPTSRWADEFTGTWHDWAHSLAGRGIAVLLPNPRGSTGRGWEFANALVNEVGHGEFRDIMAGVDAMIERGIADPDRLGIGGWSWGGYMTSWAISQSDRFRAAVVGAGLPNMVSDNGVGDIPSANLSYFRESLYENPEPFWERSPIRYVRNVKTPTLILHGEEDRRVAMSQGLELYTALRLLGVEVEFVTYPREGHGILETKHQRDLIQRVTDWFTRRLGALTGGPNGR